jgi:hypothetical protein
MTYITSCSARCWDCRLLTIVRSALREGCVVCQRSKPSVRRRRTARATTRRAFRASVLALALFGGSNWWAAEERTGGCSKPMLMQASVKAIGR